VKWVSPRPGVGRGESAQQPGHRRVEQHAGDPVPEPHPVTLGRVMEKCRGDDVGVGVPAGPQPGDDVERVASVGHRHGRVEPPGVSVKDATDLVFLAGSNASREVGDELADAVHGQMPVSARATDEAIVKIQPSGSIGLST